MLFPSNATAYSEKVFVQMKTKVNFHFEIKQRLFFPKDVGVLLGKKHY